MYYSEISAFDRTPINTNKVASTIPTPSVTEVIESNESGDNFLLWSVIGLGLGAVGFIFLIRYLDSPGYTNSKKF